MHDFEAMESDSTTAATKLRGRMVPMDSALRTPVPKIYGVENWGQGYFDVNSEGHLTVRPLRDDRHVDIYKEVRALVDQRHLPPLLVRFPQILDSQVRALQRAFANSIREFDYPRSYQGVFPMKVNPQRVVVERLLQAGAESKLGLEVGSKPELYLGLALEQAPGSLLICNGFKDDEFMEMAFWGHRLGKKVVIVIEQLREVHSYIRVAERTGQQPMLGLRGKLYTRGSGKWEESGGETSKFGLATIEMLECVRVLREHGMEQSLAMLHFHIGSQITDIRKIKAAVREASRVYARFRHMGIAVQYLNVGGGLGIDYDGSGTSSDSSVNYTLQEFANDVVYTAADICRNENVEPPTLVSESGRALTVFHSVLVVSAENRFNPNMKAREELKLEKMSPALVEMQDILAEISVKNFREYYHDALQRRDEIFSLFDLGYITLDERALAELLFQDVCEKALRYAKQTNHRSDDFDLLAKALRKKYISNFSVFQSVPDSWTIEHLFPVLPIHRLNETPTEYGILADMSCDSDGQIDSFVDVKDIKETLELHTIRPGEPYYLGICLVGAYQEVMGSFHNLFGRVNEVSLVVTDEGEIEVESLARGNGIGDVVEMVGYDVESLRDAIDHQVAQNLAEGRIDEKDAREIRDGYRARATHLTYLELP